LLISLYSKAAPITQAEKHVFLSQKRDQTRLVLWVDSNSNPDYSASVGIRAKPAPYVTSRVTFACSRFVPAGATNPKNPVVSIG
jgi:hypothetical protein